MGYFLMMVVPGIIVLMNTWSKSHVSSKPDMMRWVAFMLAIIDICLGIFLMFYFMMPLV